MRYFASCAVDAPKDWKRQDKANDFTPKTNLQVLDIARALLKLFCAIAKNCYKLKTTHYMLLMLIILKYICST